MIQRIRKLATGGTASIAATVAATNVLRIVSSMTLTRLLDPYSYGVVGVITSVAFMLTMLSDAGFYPFIIRHARADEPRFLDEVWTIRLIRGIILTLLMIVLARPAALVLGKPELTVVIGVWGCSFLIDGLSALSFALGVRQQKLWRVGLMDMIAGVVTLAGSITAALIWRSYWAMIVGMLLGQVARAVLSYTMFPGSPRRFRISRTIQRELWTFSRYIGLSSILTLFILQFDKVAMARMMPLAAYGYYAIATTLAVAPEAIAVPYAQRVLYPVYARIARDNRPALRETFYAARRRVTLLYSAAVGGLIGAAPLVVELIYDPRYRQVAPFLQLLSVRVFLRMPLLSANEVLLALGKTGTALAINIFRVVWLVIGGAIALWRHDVMLLVTIVATDQVPGTLWFWYALAREGVLDLRQECEPFLVGLGGLAAGLAIAALGMKVVH